MIVIASPMKASHTEHSMKEILLTVSSKGQVTIPIDVRRRLGADKTRKIALVIDEKNGDIHLRVPQYPTIASLRGAAGTLPKKMSWKEIREIAYEDQHRGKTAKTRE
jgi:bifunctional DNA-binding transcriptional regulator/antitoxin component of YhaV-PrlF toxin-antitoxin module